MSKRYIDAEPVEKNIRILLDIHPFELVPRICKKVEDMAVNAVKLTPTADVAEISHGRWLHENNPNTYIYEYRPLSICSECGHTRIGDRPYCSECGAKMDGERREENEG